MKDRTSERGLRYHDSNELLGSPSAMTRGTMYVRSRSKVSVCVRLLEPETKCRATRNGTSVTPEATAVRLCVHVASLLEPLVSSASTSSDSIRRCIGLIGAAAAAALTGIKETGCVAAPSLLVDILLICACGLSFFVRRRVRKSRSARVKSQLGICGRFKYISRRGVGVE